MTEQRAKTANLLIAGSGTPARKVDIFPGITAGDLLAQFNFDGHVSINGNPTEIGANTELYPLISDGAKIVLSPPGEVAREQLG